MRQSFLGTVSFIAAALSLASYAHAATSYQVLHSFEPFVFNVHPPLVRGSDGALYGTASGGSNGRQSPEGPIGAPPGNGGIVFKVNPDGTGLRVLHEFDGYWNFRHPNTRAVPMSVISGDGVLYGTALQDYGSGLLFRLNEDGSHFQVIHRFGLSHDPTVNDQGNPLAPLTYSKGVLYGTTTYGAETIFRLAPDGSDFRTLSSEVGSEYPLLDIDGVLYGSGLFKINEDGSGFAWLLPGSYFGTGEIVTVGGRLYGVASDSLWTRLIYTINLDGSDYKELSWLPDFMPFYTYPMPEWSLMPGLASDGGMLYSVTYGGDQNSGYVYRLNIDGSGLEVVYRSPALLPYGTPTVVDGHVFGATATAPDPNYFRMSFFRVGVDGSDYTPFSAGIPPDPWDAPAYGPWPNPVTTRPVEGNGILYGITTHQVFSVREDGSDFAVLHDFGTSRPLSLSRVGSALYGTTAYPGQTFAMNVDGSGFRGLDCCFTSSELLHAGGVFYGLSTDTAFKVNKDGTGVQILHWFTSTEGLNPTGPLVLVNGNLYGIATDGGPNGMGTLFSMSEDGSNFRILHSFGGSGDGAHPVAGLVASGTAVFGMTRGGGTSSAGTVFRLDAPTYARTTTSSYHYEKIHDFTGLDGKQPEGTLSLRNGLLYGTTAEGGNHKAGVAFEMATDGGSFRKLFNFGGTNGKRPLAGLTFGSDGALYGTTNTLGPVGGGVLFRLVP